MIFTKPVSLNAFDSIRDNLDPDSNGIERVISPRKAILTQFFKPGKKKK
jgi:hypothetical protein